MYNYTNPKMQEVAKFCARGFWPICKNEYGEFAIFTPLKASGKFRRSEWKDYLEKAKDFIGSFWHSDSDSQPTEIVGFYHPPTPLFEMGDRVRVRRREDLEETLVERTKSVEEDWKLKAGQTGTIITYKSKNSYIVSFGGSNWEFTANQLEPFIEPEPVIVEMTVAEIEEKLGVKNLKIVK